MAEVVFRTSGSTGAPKEIRRETAQLAADAANLVRTFPALSEGGPQFLASIRSEHFFGALWRDRVPGAAGCQIDPAVILTVEELLEKAARAERNVLVTTPSFLEKALGHPDFAELRGRFSMIITSGSALRRPTALAVATTLGVCPTEIYGSTEAGSIAWRRQTEGTEARLFEGVEGEQDATGRLVLHSPFAMEDPLVMSDLVRFTSTRTFELLGRADRLVKVLEEFVSLTAVERALEGHELIVAARAETYGEEVPRIGAVCVLSPAGREALASGTYARLVGRLRKELSAGLGAAAFPRRIRFVRELPSDARGKCPPALIREGLQVSCREPVVLAWMASAERLEAELVFPPDAEIFQGHFPGFPVVPGVAQLYFLRHFSRQVFAAFPETGSYRKLKFRRLIRPGERVALQVTGVGARAFEFSLAVDGVVATSGILTGGAE